MKVFFGEGTTPQFAFILVCRSCFYRSFTQAALLAYAVSNYFRSKGAVTVLGGPHARCYPDDYVKYFDYVLGFTHKSTIMEVLDNCESQRAMGKQLSEKKQPSSYITRPLQNQRLQF